MKYKDAWTFNITDEINTDLQEQIFEEIKEQISFFKKHSIKNAKVESKNLLQIAFKFSIELLDFSEDDDSTITITEE